MARVNGRLLRPSNLDERRVFKHLGVDFIHVSRGRNPFAVARMLSRLAKSNSAELSIIREILEDDRVRRPLLPIPDPMIPDPLGPASPWCPHAARA
jgi:hypothetical protein